jgi:pyruvate/2-oxoglutarate/acetoin dehydrogenase E1 component
LGAKVAFDSLAAPVTRVSGGNVPLPVAASLEAEVDVTAARIVAAALAVVGYDRRPQASQHGGIR